VTRRSVPTIAATIAVALLAASCGGGEDDASGEIVPSVDAEAGDRLPDVDIVPLRGGETVSLADIDGPAVVNLWATWCAPCRREIPDFEAVHRARGDEVRFVGINIGEDADDAAEFLDDVGATYDQYLDSAGFVVTELRTATMPVTLVLDADGAISTKHLGPMDQDDLDAAIDEALAG
jgi:Thiol-disulfide isomerase and thioredoxins